MTRPPAVVVVDDEPSMLETIGALLAPDRYQTTFLSNGAAVLERLAAAPADLILCDVMMPGMDGFEVCRTVKSHSEWRFIPLILVTALDGQDDMIRGLDAGADEFLSKPVEKVVLRARVRTMLRIRSQYVDLQHRGTDVESLLKNRREGIIGAAGLTAREREVLELVLLGRTHEDVATALGISARTAKFHQANLLEKLGAESRMDLLRLFA